MSAVRLTVIAWSVWLLLAAPVVAMAKAPLADAVESRSVEVVRVLLTQKTDVNAQQADGMTAVHWAAHHDDLEIVRSLIAAGADVSKGNRYGVTPLSIACTNGSTEVVEALLEAGADPNTLAGGETVLMTAARTGRLGPVEALIASGADINAREHRGQTALIWAAAEGNLEVVDTLIKHGADFRPAKRAKLTPFFFAVREGRTDVAFRLITAGADVNEVMRPSGDGYRTNALILAIENGHFELADALLKAGAKPNEHPAGYTALHAITWVRKPIRGDGNPPPLGSGRLNSLEIVRQLLKRGADINSRLEHGKPELGKFTTTGATPFFLAARASDIPLMKLLVESGADTNLSNVENCTPLLAASGVGALSDGDEAAGTEDEAFEAVRFLLELGADANAVDDNGETAMHGAAYQSRAKLVSLLAERSGDISVWNRKNTSGWTPLMIAQGHRPANFRPSSDTIAAIERTMRDGGVEPPKATRPADRRGY